MLATHRTPSSQNIAGQFQNSQATAQQPPSVSLSGPASRMKVRVSMGDVKLVIPVGRSDDKVSRLVDDISRRFQNKGIKPGTLRLQALKTIDGYEINSNDVIEMVINDNDLLLAFDYEDWAKSEFSKMKKSWQTFYVNDFETGDGIFIIVGHTDLGKLLVAFGTGWYRNQLLKRIEVFDVDSLTSFGKSGKVPIASEQGKTWKSEASFIVEVNKATAVEISIKTVADNAAHVRHIGINYDDGVISAGAIKNVSAPTYKVGKYTPPARTAKGPTIPTQTYVTSAPSDAKSSGSGVLKLVQTEPARAWQSWKRDGQFYNSVGCQFEITNKSNSILSIAKVRSEYKNAKGEWVAPAETTTGSSRDYLNAPQNFKIGGESMEPLFVATSIIVKGEQLENHRRTHRSLPDPIHVRVTLEEVNGNTTTIEYQYKNPALELRTLESLKSDDSNIFWASFCDDTDADVRIGVWTSLQEDGTQFRLHLSNTYRNFTIKDLRRLVYEATKKKTPEVDLEHGSSENDGKFVIKTFALVDINAGYVNAIRVELKTTTSSVIDYVVIPQLKSLDDE